MLSNSDVQYAIYGAVSVTPSAGPLTGGTDIRIAGPYLDNGEEYLCRFDFAVDSEAVSASNETSNASTAKNLTSNSNTGSSSAESVDQTQTMSDQNRTIAANLSAAPNASGTPPTLFPTSIVVQAFAERSAGAMAIRCTSPQHPAWQQITQDATSRLYIANVSVSLLGTGGFADDNKVAFGYYRSPKVLFVTPSFASAAGGIHVTVHGSGFLQLVGIRCRTGSGAETDGVFQNASVLICAVGSTCSNRACQLGAVQVSLNGQQFGASLVAFGYYFVGSIVPSGGALEGGTLVSVLGGSFDLAEQHKCRFSYNLVEVPATFIDSETIVCRSPQGRQFSSVEVCVGTAFSALSQASVGCLNRWTRDYVSFVHYSVYPLISILPTSGPSVGGYNVSLSLWPAQFDADRISDMQFRSYTPGHATCKFGTVIVQASILNATHMLCPVPSWTAISPGSLAGSTSVSVSLNRQDYTKTQLGFSFHIITNTRPFGRPASCQDPPCQFLSPAGMMRVCFSSFQGSVVLTLGTDAGQTLVCQWCSEALVPPIDQVSATRPIRTSEVLTCLSATRPIRTAAVLTRCMAILPAPWVL